MIPIRDENPSHSLPIFTIFFIFVNAIVFLNEVSLGVGVQHLVYQLGAIPIEVINNANLPKSETLPPYLTLITSMFLHGGWLHMIGNMWFLWIFGDNVEDTLGHINFLIFYFVCGIVATLTHIFFNPTSEIPLIGASGAISGVLGAYFILHPRIRILTLVPIFIFLTFIRIPAYIFLFIWILLQFTGWMQPLGQVAYGAHVGGFITGMILILLMSKKKKYRTTYSYQARRLPRHRF